MPFSQHYIHLINEFAQLLIQEHFPIILFFLFGIIRMCWKASSKTTFDQLVAFHCQNKGIKKRLADAIHRIEFCIFWAKNFLSPTLSLFFIFGSLYLEKKKYNNNNFIINFFLRSNPWNCDHNHNKHINFENVFSDTFKAIHYSHKKIYFFWISAQKKKMKKIMKKKRKNKTWCFLAFLRFEFDRTKKQIKGRCYYFGL